MPQKTDPSSMSDEELDKAIDPEIEEQESEEPDEPELEETEEPEEVEETEEEEPKPPSRREQLRIQQVLSKLKEDREAPKPKATPDALDYEKALDADPELIAQLKADREKSNNAFYQQGIEQAKSIQFHTRLEIDAPRVEAKYPQLDKDSDKFNPELANAINTMFLSTVGYDESTDTVKNPNLRYAPYVESIFELAGEIAGEKTAEVTKHIKSQAAKTGLRPDGSSGKKLNLNKPPEQMTDEELDAVIAQAVPKR